MSGTTDRGKYLLLKYAFDGETVPTTYRLILCTDDDTPTKASNTLADVTEIASGSGYDSGGKALATSDATVTEVDGTIGAKVVFSDQTWSATGTFPSSGTGARWAVITDGTTSSDNILAYFSLGSNQTLTSGQSLTLQSIEIDCNEPS